MDEVHDSGSPLDDVARPQPTAAGPGNYRVTMERSETIVVEVLARSSRDAEARALLQGDEVASRASQFETVGVARVQLLCPACDRTVQSDVDAGIDHHISPGDLHDAGHYHPTCCPVCLPRHDGETSESHPTQRH